jgi:zinc protease
MSTIADNFGESLALLADIALRPRLDPGELERRRAQHVARALAAEADPHSGRRAAMYRALFGDGYAGQLPDGTRPTLEKITHGDVTQHYRRVLVAEGASVVVTGGIDRAAVAEHVARAFGAWTGKSDLTERKPTASADRGKLYFVDYPGAPQSVIAAVRRAPGALAEDYFEASVFNRSFGQSFASRVNLNLREDKGYTYGAFSHFQHFRQIGFLGIFADVRTDVTRSSVEEVLRELSDIRGPRPLTAQERDSSVGGLLLGYPGTFDSIDLLASRLAVLPLQGRPLDWYSTWPEQVASVTLEGANAAAQRYCDVSEFSLIVAGDAATVAEGLDELGFERVNVDATGQRI